MKVKRDQSDLNEINCAYHKHTDPDCFTLLNDNEKVVKKLKGKVFCIAHFLHAKCNFFKRLPKSKGKKIYILHKEN